MSIIFGLVLIALGLLAVEHILLEKVRPLGILVSKIEPYAPFIGLTGLIVGVVWLVESIALLHHLMYHPILLVLILWGSTALMLCLGLIFGLEMLGRIISEPPPKFVVKAGKWRADLLPYRNKLGAAAIPFGIIHILYFF